LLLLLLPCCHLKELVLKRGMISLQEALIELASDKEVLLLLLQVCPLV